MASSNHISAVLFWLMVLAGTVALVPCVILPPLFEYHAQQAVLAATEQRNVELRDRFASVENQVESLENDPAYIERLARQEFGIVPAGVRTIPVSAAEDQPETAASDADANKPSASTEMLPDVTVRVQQLLHRYPLARVFVWSETRPVLMLLGGIMLVSAVVLLGNSRQVPKPAEDERVSS
ncbi:MAG: septum formation initiator family protein [Phycisphaerae bacterium]|nr:septum formation initiator family protein [Phycisphaerae bacterium]